MSTIKKLERNIKQNSAAFSFECFAFLMDGWTVASILYSACFVAFVTNCSCRYCIWLLAFSAVVDETILGLKEHSKFLECALILYRMTCINVVCRIGDSFSTNKYLKYISN